MEKTKIINLQEYIPRGRQGKLWTENQNRCMISTMLWILHKNSSQEGTVLHYYTSSACYGEGTGTPLQYSCLENPMDGGAW